MLSAPTFYVVPGSTVKRVIDDNKKQVFDAVEGAYRLHGSGNTINPESYFLRYPDRPSARIIALPAHVGGAVQKSGIKWISSFPENRASNLARASAVLILNDATTGYPLACVEASLISATRTAASAALSAEPASTDRPELAQVVLAQAAELGRQPSFQATRPSEYDGIVSLLSRRGWQTD